MNIISNLIYIVITNDSVKSAVQVVEEVNDLHGRGRGAELGEADDVAKVNGHTFETLRLHYFTRHQLLCYRPI